MTSRYFCAHCDDEFVLEEAESKPRCPRCMRRSGLERVEEETVVPGTRRRWIAFAAVALVICGLGYGVYRARNVPLEDEPPLRPLTAEELAAYLERDQVQAGAYASLFALPSSVEGWPKAADELAKRFQEESRTWSLEQALPREVLTADQALAAMTAEAGRTRLYPLEAAAAMTALLRQQGTKAMVAEAWELPGARAPADPSGMLGYFVTAVYEGEGPEPSAYVDAWGGRGIVELESVRVLRDTEAVGAALGAEAVRIFTRSGDRGQALPMIETALRLDPVSPSLRVAHATVLVESGGIPEALRELEAAIQLRPDGPRKLNLVQLTLAQAGMLQANGEQTAAEAQFGEANRAVVEVLDAWPRYGRAHLILATIHLGLEETERALLELQAAERLSPESPMLWAVWAQVDLGTEDPTSALAKMNRAIRLDPENWQLQVQAAGIFLAAGEESGAREHAARALELVAPDRRDALESYLERMMGPEPAPSETPASASEPALMLGDPSKLQLRDPSQELRLDEDLDLDE